jgi:hypothetical protein
MTQNDEPAPIGRTTALARVRELAGFFDALKATFLTQLGQIGSDGGLPSKAHVAKLAELQAIHVQLLKAEDSFIEKFGTGNDDADIDYGAIRIEIGRTLDRIRDTAGASGVSGGADGPAAAGLAASV